VSRLLLVLGGARSGKSAYAEGRVLDERYDDVAYIATLLPGDPDVDARIAAHRARRPAAWQTIDAGNDLPDALRDAAADALLLDGFELALALADPPDDDHAVRLATDTAAAARNAARVVAVVVSAEAGMGVVPSTAAGVAFRDRLGAANQALARAADEVVLVVAGLPLAIKGATA
jgi:adenosyl cobinamide kinase/adenosyl cobinamide phosphate guanylyltransferase